MQTKIVTPEAPKALGPFSQGINFEKLVFTAGQIHLTKDGELIDSSVEEKVHQVMKNLKSILQEANSGFEKVLKVTIYLTDMQDYAKVNETYATYMSDPFPARETVCVKELPLGATVEISMIAYKD